MIHPSAIIDPAAVLGKNVSVGAFTIIGADVTIGDDCWVGPHVVMSGPCIIGKQNKIFQFASIGEAPQDLKYAGEPTLLEIGDRNVIREFVTLNRGTITGNSKTIIGCDNLIMAYCHVAHDCIVGNHVILANGASLAGHVEVGDYAILGGFTLVHQFSQIGSQSFCGMGSIIAKDVPPFSTVGGERARTVGINKEGLRRKGFSAEVIRALHKSYRLLFVSKATKDEAMEELQPLIEQFDEVQQFTQFVINSKRGIAR
ncbi:MAG: acyl-ACP--UDP-N-acetylglucosamine O-acyltransferase [Thiotrichaceae bacterium]|nr:acyl-ACP--UDP-N-acetylglucosamine O-acyltransferase [Thiotrichaceae bacterium]